MPMTEAEIEALKKSHARIEKLYELNDAQRAYYKCLPASEQEAFISKSAGDRAAALKSAVAYEASDGTTYYHHDDSRLVKMAKDSDESKKSLVMETALRKNAEFAKAAAEDMSSYPEDAAIHAAVIAAVEGIADEATRKAARTLIKAGNAAIAKAGVATGTGGDQSKVVGGNSEIAKAETELKTAVEAYGKAKGITRYELAFVEASQSDPATRSAFDKVAILRRQAQA